jgi:hypothetical protein
VAPMGFSASDDRSLFGQEQRRPVADTCAGSRLLRVSYVTAWANAWCWRSPRPRRDQRTAIVITSGGEWKPAKQAAPAGPAAHPAGKRL